ncbi:MAG TPA: hypothetical protein VF009_05115 [Solirubrobacterales bacterium]
MRGRFGRRRAWTAAALLLLALTLALGGVASGERSQFGNVIVSLDGRISPLRLPRHRPAPVFVHVSGALRTANGATLPRVSRIELRFAGPGTISSKGLPRCPMGRLRHTTHLGALAACRPALVGHGTLRAQVLVAKQPPFEVKAQLLAFNARLHGRQALLLHGYASDPPTSAVIPFLVRHPGGRSRTVLEGTVPRGLGPWPHFARFALTFGRRYVYRGERRSFLSAKCPVPRRFSAGFLSVARIAYTFVNGRRVGRDIVRSCRAR